MIELVALICLAAQPSVCRDETLAVAHIAPSQCLSGAQIEIAKWSMNHPAWRVAKWKCQFAGKTAGA